MRIAIFCHLYPPHVGGVETVVSSLATHLSGRNRVTVVTSAWEGRAGISNEDGVTVIRLPAIHLTERFGVPYPVPVGPFVRAALDAARSADVVNVHGALYLHSVLGLRAARRASRPVVLTEHVGIVEYRSTVLRTIQALAWKGIGHPTARAASAITSCSGRVQIWLQGSHPSQKVDFIPNGVDTKRFHPLEPEERTRVRDRFGIPQTEVIALFVGRASGKKNLDQVLEFDRRTYQLVVCGANRRNENVRTLDLGLVPPSDMPQVYGCADLLIHAGVGEGFPVAVQEAMACGLPVAMLWDAGYGGNLSRSEVLSAESFEELSRHASLLSVNASLRRELSIASRRWAESRWGWNVSIEKYRSLFETLVRESPLNSDEAHQ